MPDAWPSSGYGHAEGHGPGAPTRGPPPWVPTSQDPRETPGGSRIVPVLYGHVTQRARGNDAGCVADIRGGVLASSWRASLSGMPPVSIQRL